MTDGRPAGDIVYVVERFPELSQTFIQNELRALHEIGIEPRVFALYPPAAIDPTADGLEFAELPSAEKAPKDWLRALGRVGRQRPGALARAVGVAVRRPSRLQFHALAKAVLLLDRLDGDDVHRFHAHFARASASVAMLVARATGAKFSYTAHALDIFRKPFDMDRKLRAADVSVTVCEYNRRFMEEHWPGLGHIEIVPCGVDPAAFRRSAPYRRDPFTVVATGRLVEKKGFDDLVRACGVLDRDGVEFTCRIVGEGPERTVLEALIEDHGLHHRVHLEGAIAPNEVRDVLEAASVFCLPCVVAADGDRDSMPVVVKEAMAMAIPVVVTDEVGNPEMVDPSCGWLVPPRDPRALAAALAEAAATDEATLRTMGEAGRRRIEDRLSLAQQAARMGGLLRS